MLKLKQIQKPIQFELSCREAVGKCREAVENCRQRQIIKQLIQFQIEMIHLQIHLQVRKIHLKQQLIHHVIIHLVKQIQDPLVLKCKKIDLLRIHFRLVHIMMHCRIHIHLQQLILVNLRLFQPQT